MHTAKFARYFYPILAIIALSTASFAAPTHPSRFWRWLAALTIAGTIYINYYANVHPFNGSTMGDVSARYLTLLTPDGYTFSIWGVIFLGLAIYAVWQLLPAQRDVTLPDVVARPLTIATAGAGVWVVLFAYEQIGLSVLTMLVILVAIIAAYGEARQLVRDNTTPHWVSIPFALFLGWIMVAAIVNLTMGIRVVTDNVFFQIELYLSYLFLFIIVVLGLLLSYVFQERTFSLVLCWALVGVWHARVLDVPNFGWASLAAAAIVLIVGLVLAQQGRELQATVARVAAAEAAAEKAAAEKAAQRHHNSVRDNK